MFLDARLAKILLLQFLVASVTLNPTVDFSEDALSIADQVSLERMVGHAKALTGFKTRYALARECNASAKFLYEYFSSLEGFNVAFHPFKIDGLAVGLNVVATKNGTNRAREYVLLFAHYDSISRDPYVSAPGANDNACGVAVMMEVAYLMSKLSLNRTLTFIGFSGEELGLLGSNSWVEEHGRILNGTVAGICLDGVGRGDGISIMFADYESKPLADLALNVSMALGFEDFRAVGSALGVGGSDSGAFLGRGLRIIRLWDEDTAYIHTPKDTLDTVYPDRLVKTAKVVAALLYALSTEPLEELFPEAPKARPEEGGAKLVGAALLLGFALLFALTFVAAWKFKGPRAAARSANLLRAYSIPLARGYPQLSFQAGLA